MKMIFRFLLACDCENHQLFSLCYLSSKSAIFSCMALENIRNFAIIAHIDHGKSTLADRFLEITKTVESRKMSEQFLDSMELEKERGITIKMKPVRMVWSPNHTDRGLSAEATRNSQNRPEDLLYKDLTCKIRGIMFNVRKNLGLGHKEQIYQNAIELEFKKSGIYFESKKNISIMYEGSKIGMYQPDFVVENKIIIELKALPEIGRPQIEQVWGYLKGCEYKLALLINFGSNDLEIRRIVYDIARANGPASSALSPRFSAGVSDQIEPDFYVLNLIDTPGHIDFAYEVSRSLKAIEGVILLIDATQGVQAQTLSTLGMAREEGVVIIPAVSKIDSPLARANEVKEEISRVLKCDLGDILEVSGKTGQGVPELLKAVIEKVPPPQLHRFDKKVGSDSLESAVLRDGKEESLQALIFDFQYSNHTGVILFVRVFGGTAARGGNFRLIAGKKDFSAIEVGYFHPDEVACENILPGEIGYIVTGIKEPGVAKVGDTVTTVKSPSDGLSGYLIPRPVVWASVFPGEERDFEAMRHALSKLRLSDSSLSFEEESSGTLGRGFRCGFLGMLHMEIVIERLRREHNLEPIVTMPSVNFEVTDRNGKMSVIYSPAKFPEYGAEYTVREPWASLEIISPPDYLGVVMNLLFEHEAEVGDSQTLSETHALVKAKLPLRELMRNFFDEIKSATSGYASFSYVIDDMRDSDIIRLDAVLVGEVMPAFARVVSRKRMQEEAEALVEKLFKVLPRQLFTVKIQARALGRILSSRTISALKKDVTGYLYGGDITRKRKLWEKQKKGKKRLQESAKLNVPHHVFLEMVKR